MKFVLDRATGAILGVGILARDGAWVDGILFGLVEEDLNTAETAR